MWHTFEPHKQKKQQPQDSPQHLVYPTKTPEQLKAEYLANAELFRQSGVDSEYQRQVRKEIKEREQAQEEARQEPFRLSPELKARLEDPQVIGAVHALKGRPSYFHSALQEPLLDPKYQGLEVNLYYHGRASLLCQLLGAQAFALGNHIFIRSDLYFLPTGLGQRLLAHEMEHLYQQQGQKPWIQRQVEEKDLGTLAPPELLSTEQLHHLYLLLQKADPQIREAYYQKYPYLYQRLEKLHSTRSTEEDNSFSPQTQTEETVVKTPELPPVAEISKEIEQEQRWEEEQAPLSTILQELAYDKEMVYESFGVKRNPDQDRTASFVYNTIIRHYLVKRHWRKEHGLPEPDVKKDPSTGYLHITAATFAQASLIARQQGLSPNGGDYFVWETPGLSEEERQRFGILPVYELRLAKESQIEAYQQALRLYEQHKDQNIPHPGHDLYTFMVQEYQGSFEKYQQQVLPQIHHVSSVNEEDFLLNEPIDYEFPTEILLGTVPPESFYLLQAKLQKAGALKEVAIEYFRSITNPISAIFKLVIDPDLDKSYTEKYKTQLTALGYASWFEFIGEIFYFIGLFGKFASDVALDMLTENESIILQQREAFKDPKYYRLFKHLAQSQFGYFRQADNARINKMQEFGEKNEIMDLAKTNTMAANMPEYFKENLLSATITPEKRETFMEVLLHKNSRRVYGFDKGMAYDVPGGNFALAITGLVENKHIKEARAWEGKARLNTLAYAKHFPILADISLDLRTLAYTQDDKVFRETLESLMQYRLDKIAELRQKIQEDPSVVWELAPVIDKAKLMANLDYALFPDLFVKEYLDVLEFAKILRDVVLTALGIVLAFSGLGWLALAGGLLLGATDVYLTHKDYSLQKAAYNSAFDKADALASEDPSIFWLALSIVGVVADAFSVLKVFSKLKGPAKSANASGDLLKMDEALDEMVKKGELPEADGIKLKEDIRKNYEGGKGSNANETKLPRAQRVNQQLDEALQELNEYLMTKATLQIVSIKNDARLYALVLKLAKAYIHKGILTAQEFVEALAKRFKGKINLDDPNIKKELEEIFDGVKKNGDIGKLNQEQKVIIKGEYVTHEFSQAIKLGEELGGGTAEFFKAQQGIEGVFTKLDGEKIPFSLKQLTPNLETGNGIKNIFREIKDNASQIRSGYTNDDALIKQNCILGENANTYIQVNVTNMLKEDILKYYLSIDEGRRSLLFGGEGVFKQIKIIDKNGEEIIFINYKLH